MKERSYVKKERSKRPGWNQTKAKGQELLLDPLCGTGCQPVEAFCNSFPDTKAVDEPEHDPAPIWDAGTLAFGLGFYITVQPSTFYSVLV